MLLPKSVTYGRALKRAATATSAAVALVLIAGCGPIELGLQRDGAPSDLSNQHSDADIAETTEESARTSAPKDSAEATATPTEKTKDADGEDAAASMPPTSQGNESPDDNTLPAENEPAAAPAPESTPDPAPAPTVPARSTPKPAPAPEPAPAPKPAPEPAPAPKPAPAPDPGPAGGVNAYEAEVLSLTNAERRKAGCGNVSANSKLAQAAGGHSADMAAKDYFSHTSQDGSSMSDRVDRTGYAWRGLAENIAAGQRTPSSVVDGWMNSSGHRANIENCSLTQLGVGLAYRGDTPYWTQNFGTPP